MSGTARPGLGSATRATAALSVAMAAYLLLNGISIRISGFARMSYGVVALLALVFAARALWKQDRIIVPRALLAWSAFMLIEMGQVVVRINASATDAVTDLAVVMLPIVFFVFLASARPTADVLLCGLAGLAAAGLLAAVIAWNASQGSRFEAAPIVTVIVAWALALWPLDSWRSPRVRRRARQLAWIAVPLLLPLLVASGSRTALAVWAFGGLFFLLLPHRRRAALGVTFSVLGLITCACLIYWGPTIQQESADFLDRARLSDLAAGQLDVSSAVRLSEAQDAITTMRREGGMLDYLMGFGHGSSYLPDNAFIETNVDEESGRVHNIHITPVAVWFRYGLVGLCLFLALLCMVVLAAVRNHRELGRPVDTVFLAMTLMYVFDLLIRFSVTDPIFSWTVAAVLARRTVSVLDPDTEAQPSS